MINRVSGRMMEVEAHITANNETKIFELFKITGSVRILNQWIEISDDTALTNCTNVYSTLYDGTNTIDLTADGLDLSGSPVGSFFTKDKLSTLAYSLNKADQCRLLETIDAKKVGRPFTVTQKNGADTFIRLHVTTNTSLDFKMRIHFEYALLDGGGFELA